MVDFVDVPIGASDFEECEEFGVQLYERKRGGDKLHRRADGSVTSIQANIDGKLAEVAFGRWAGLPVNFDITDKNDGNVDFVLPTGKTVDVKRMGRRGYDFNPVRTSSIEDFTIDIGVMAWPGPTALVVTLVGWIDRDTFREVCVSRDFGYGIRHTVPWRRLFPMRSLELGALQRAA